MAGDETIIASGVQKADDPYVYAFLGGSGKAFLRRNGEFISFGRGEGNHLPFALNPEISQIHGLLWYGALEGQPRRALYAVDVSRNGLFLPSQEVAIKDVPRWKADGRALRLLGESALVAIRNARKGLNQALPGFWPADHAAFRPEDQLEYKEAALTRVLERFDQPIGIACLDDLASPGKDVNHLRLRREADTVDVVRIEPGALLHKDRVARDARA